MQIEISLNRRDGDGFSARDLGFLLHKHPEHVHRRDTAAGVATIFFSEIGERRSSAVLHLDVDPIRLVRGSGGADGPLAQYVNDRPYVANSFLSVALARSFGQSMSGKSKERQELADQPLSLEARVTPVAAAGGEEIIRRLFEPLGYAVSVSAIDATTARGVYDLRIAAETRLGALLNHLYVLTPVLDNAKHWWIDRDEVEKLLAKGEGWLADHPEKELIANRALKHRRSLAEAALARLTEETEVETEPHGEDGEEATAEATAAAEPERALERPLRLHDLRLDRVAETIRERRATSVLDLGCGEGRLLARLVKQQGVERLLGVDPSIRTLEVAARRLRLPTAGDSLRERLALQPGSLTYGDRRWRGFDAATLVEVIEHIDPARLSALELSLFAEARPRLVIVTTPNREYNALFEGMAPGALRHGDHRFEWTRAEFDAWATRVGAAHGYAVAIEPLGPIDATHGAPSQMAVFEAPGSELAA